ncbi:MAG: DUF3515 domain-containing protein [Actinomycetota bacterium]|nr:DUF3515 domain-containing protein [Actinomycetota bacterium]
MTALVSCAPMPVAVDAPAPEGAAATACQRLAQQLPETLDGLERRDVEPRTLTAAAWGEPPVVMRCGVPPPTALRPTSELFVVNGIDWFAEPLQGGAQQRGVRFTTTGRVANITVTVPAAHAPEADVLVDLAAPVAAAVPPVPPVPPAQ